MWHEARRREKATQKLLNDHRKRAEKRRQEDRVDPNSLLQVHGIKSRLYPDLSAHKQIAKSLVVWQGDSNVTIDRFDVRATLTAIPSEGSTARGTKDVQKTKKTATTVVDLDESDTMRKLLTYERYRLLIQNDVNQVPEGSRLKLVEQSEHLGDARLRKLQRNWFGTSGEAVGLQEPTNKPATQNRQSHSREKPIGVSIGYNYNQSSTTQSVVDQRDASIDSHQVRNIVDLDDYGDFDIDDMVKPQSSTRKVNEITSRYGISGDEFNLLIEADRNESHQSDLIKELKRVEEKAIKKSMSKTYGPVLPPDMESATSNPVARSPSLNASSTHSSPVGQRSPSGADIPLRNGDSSRNEPEIQAEELKFESEIKVAEHRVEPEIKVQLRIEPEIKIKLRPEPEIEQLPSTSGLNDKDPELPKIDNNQRDERPKRATTPLAYRKYRRSSRSLSRERHTSHRKSRGYRRTSSKRRSRSDSSDDSSLSSGSSRSTSSSSSSEGVSSRARSGRSRYRRSSSSSGSPRDVSKSPTNPSKRSRTKHKTNAHSRRSRRHGSQKSPKKRG